VTRRARFEALFEAHYLDVQRFLLRRTDLTAAEELTNEVFLICWRRLEQVPEHALPWLYVTARKCLANHRRAAARHARRERAAAHEFKDTIGRDPAERFAERDAVLRAFATLDERDREALRLVAWEGLSVADAARAVGTSRAAFGMRLHRARRRVAALLTAPEPSAVEVEIGACR
jgi:RNA polymerase sigma factor (sigma-70 family)